MKSKLLLLIFMMVVTVAFSHDPYQEPSLNEVILRAKKARGVDQERLRALVALVNSGHDLFPPDSTIALLQELLELNGRLRSVDPQPYRYLLSGQELLQRNHPDSALQLFILAIDELDKKQYIFGFHSYLTSVAALFDRVGGLQRKLNFYRSKLVDYTLTGPALNMAGCFHGLAGCFSMQGDYDQAFTYYFKALEVYKTFSPSGYAEELSVIGYNYAKWGNFRRASMYLKLADSAGREAPDPIRSQFCYMTRALISKEEGNPADAMNYVDSALRHGIRSFRIDYAAILYAISIELRLQMNDQPGAFTLLLKMKRLCDSVDLPVEGGNGRMEVDYLFYKYYLARKELKMAGQYLLKAYDEAVLVGSAPLQQKYLVELFNLYRITGNPDRSVYFAAAYFHLNDSLMKYRNENNISRFEREDTERRKEAAIADLRQKKERQRMYFLAGGALLFLVTLGMVLRIWYIRRTKKQLEEKNKLIAAEKELAEQMRLKAEKSERFKQQFLANMSHEIRTPMNAVVGMTNLLIDKNPREDQMTYLNGIRQSSAILLHLINDILDLAKIEAGKIELETIDFSLHDLLDQILQTMRYKAAEKGLELSGNIHPDVNGIVMGDPVRLNQILINLTGNAIKFTERGNVTISVMPALPGPEGMIPVRFSVADTGIGIPADKLKTVFEEFSQASSSDTRRFGGTGLGLTISKNLVTLMGGVIRVESQSGKGTTFSFDLCFPPGSPEKLQERKNSEENIDGTILNGLTLLLADDQEFNLIVAGDTLRSKADVSITTAMNGREVIELVLNNQYDAILMDVQMPVMDGLEATRYLRENLPPQRREIPIIALTASVLKSELDRCREAGMNSFIPKPFTPSQLIGGIAEALRIPLRYKSKDTGPLIPEIAPAEHAATNLDYLEKFCEGNRDQMRKYIMMFLDSAPRLITQIHDALAKGDAAEIATQVHGFKTRWVMMGMEEAKTLASGLEQRCRQDPGATEISKEAEHLIRLVEKAIGELNEWRVMPSV
ncbi:MAG TPA: ATP-binding protein [Bacteroidales bacterium]|nr:ATP-binding protein [Bacteroidales bacterium]HPS49697.1 ATP-binding protein [Bacteroidales bacterium]